MIDFRVGDRVKVKPNCVGRFNQPWRGRFEKGRVGTVLSCGGHRLNMRLLVQFDHGPRWKPHDFQIHLYELELEEAQ